MMKRYKVSIRVYKKLLPDQGGMIGLRIMKTGGSYSSKIKIKTATGVNKNPTRVSTLRRLITQFDPGNRRGKILNFLRSSRN